MILKLFRISMDYISECYPADSKKLSSFHFNGLPKLPLNCRCQQHSENAHYQSAVLAPQRPASGGAVSHNPQNNHKFRRRPEAEKRIAAASDGGGTGIKRALS